MMQAILKLFMYPLMGYFFLTTQLMGQNYLSHLSATADAPIFSTYAAPLERSEFIVDEGYQFVWYDPSRGIDFQTDTGGNLCLAFKMNGEFRYLLSQMYQKPVVTASYNDLVKYTFYPFQNIRVDVFFDVYSSRIAIQDIEITNEGTDGIHLDVYPFLNHTTGTISGTEITPERDAFIFNHQEAPDSWTTSHGVPYQKYLTDVYLLDRPADAWGCYTESGNLDPVNFSPEVSPSQNYCVEWGTVKHEDGNICNHAPPLARQLIFHNGSDSEILTEDAPKWGDIDPSIPGNGFQGCELGNFQNPPVAPGDSFRVIFSCLASGEQASGTGIVPDVLPSAGGVNVNIQLKKDALLLPPQNVQAVFSGGGTAYLHWNPVEECTYSVYRRNALLEKGRYTLMTSGLTDTLWYDFSIQPDQRYGYIIVAQDGAGDHSNHSVEVNNLGSTAFFDDVQNDSLAEVIRPGDLKVAAFQKSYDIAGKQAARLRIIRGVIEHERDPLELLQQCRNLKNLDLDQTLSRDEQVYKNIPQPGILDTDIEMMYWNAFNLMRQCMLPPEGECSYNYYVFSREPSWGWGHGGQVFHESLAMLAYARMDSLSAINSQRVYMERQWENGYINYRTGPYLDETIPYGDQYTTSAPWFNWENWEIYRIAKDTLFLKDAYQSGKKFYQFWLDNRDADGDSLCEWGAHAVLECVRDGQVAVWDQVGWPSNFEALDLNCMLVNEAQSLAKMAQTLGYGKEAQSWSREAQLRATRINQSMWDPESGFYYNIDKTDHDFSFNKPNDLKRMEIIGFLPLWAGIASPEQAEQLVQHLQNPDEFMRKYGVPTLAASDSYYNPMGYWNGPVWLQWQYLIFRGLLRYGYVDEARQLAGRVFENVIYQLKTNHWFWELYSPDDNRAGWNKTYIWAGIVARMVLDLQNPAVGIDSPNPGTVAKGYGLAQNYPNPFNAETTIRFRIPRSSHVSIQIFDLNGREVLTLTDRSYSAGEHLIALDAGGLSSGVYYYRLVTDGYSQVKKFLLVK